MVDPVLGTTTARAVDVVALRRCLGRLQRAPAPWLHGEVARRMADRLGILKQQPTVVLDWGSHLGASADLLRRAYPHAQRLAVESEATRLPAPDATTAPAWWSPRRWSARTEKLVLESQIPPGSAQLLWANMGLHGAIDPQAAMQRWLQALAVDGFLMFSTLGPGSLRGLRAVYREMGWPSPHAAFVDMHDLGDMLVRCGFADPVMDQEIVTLTWPTAAAMLSELRGLGANVDPARAAGLRTPRWRAALEHALQRAAGDHGRVAMEFEIVYGHAVRPLPRAAMAPSASIGLDDMRTIMRSRPRR